MSRYRTSKGYCPECQCSGYHASGCPEMPEPPDDDEKNNSDDVEPPPEPDLPEYDIVYNTEKCKLEYKFP